MDLVRIAWRDAHFDYEGTGSPAEDYVVESVGFLLAEGPTFLSLAAERLPNGDGYRAITHVPLESVLELVHLEAIDGEEEAS